MTALARQLDRAKECALACRFEFDDNISLSRQRPTAPGRCIRTRSAPAFDGSATRPASRAYVSTTYGHLDATELLAAGVPVRTVSGRLGHAATTLNVYARFFRASDRHAADVMGGLLATPSAAT